MPKRRHVGRSIDLKIKNSQQLHNVNADKMKSNNEKKKKMKYIFC